MGFEPCIGADDNIYLKPGKENQGNKYNSYLIAYVGNVLLVQEDPDKYMALINRDYRLKEPLECPMMYLRTDISRYDTWR